MVPAATTVYLDCFSGISGDMLLGALLDCGLSEKALRTELGKLGLEPFDLFSKACIAFNQVCDYQLPSFVALGLPHSLLRSQLDDK